MMIELQIEDKVLLVAFTITIVVMLYILSKWGGLIAEERAEKALVGDRIDHEACIRMGIDTPTEGSLFWAFVEVNTAVQALSDAMFELWVSYVTVLDESTKNLRWRE